MRVDTQTILTIHRAVITRNPRVALQHSGHTKWHLHISDVTEQDRGAYMCQINTDPMISQVGFLQVVGEFYTVTENGRTVGVGRGCDTRGSWLGVTEVAWVGHTGVWPGMG